MIHLPTSVESHIETTKGSSLIFELSEENELILRDNKVKKSEE